MRKKNVIIVVVSVIVVGCSRQLYLPSSTEPLRQNELMRGRRLYIDHCSGCHNLHLPKEYSAAQWQRNIDDMQARSNITDEEKQLIYRYLTGQL